MLFLWALGYPVIRDSVERLSLVYAAHTDAAGWIDQRYIDHPYLSMLHLAAGAGFLILAPLQTHARMRRALPRVHRALGRTATALAVVSAVAICIMVIVFPAIGGLLTQVVTIALNMAICAALTIAIAAARSRNIKLHRAFMIRAYAIALSVATARVFIWAAETALGLPFGSSFTIASGLGVVVNLAVTELYLHAKWRTSTAQT